MEHLYLVNEIFKSIDGEGVRTGLPVIFIRLYGCNLRCAYCDTRYACDNKEIENKVIRDIVEKLQSMARETIKKNYSVKSSTVTPKITPAPV